VFPPRWKGEWRTLDLAGRQQWLARAKERHVAKGATPREGRPTEIVVDGELFDDLTGFFCAMGEAVNGPGGYFGADLMSFDNCLVGGFGVEPPYTIRWTSSERSRRCLGTDALVATYDDELARIPDDDIFDRSEDRAWIFAEALDARQRDRTLFDKIVSTIQSAAWRIAYAKRGALLFSLE